MCENPSITDLVPRDSGFTQKKTENHFPLHIDPLTLGKLQAIADSRNISVSEALRGLIEESSQSMVRKDDQEPHSLTNKQMAVLEGLKRGNSVKEIAGQLGVSEGTVRTHIQRMRSRLNQTDLLSLRFFQGGQQVE